MNAKIKSNIEKIKGWNEDVICKRTVNGLETNVPRRFTYHSPDGFEWGYGGSGPADFAWNILSIFMGKKESEIYHQDFKWDFITPMPFEGGVIKRKDILNWIEKKIKENNYV